MSFNMFSVLLNSGTQCLSTRHPYRKVQMQLFALYRQIEARYVLSDALRDMELPTGSRAV